MHEKKKDFQKVTTHLKLAKHACEKIKCVIYDSETEQSEL